MKLTKNTDTSKYGYSGYGICFDSGSNFNSGNITNGRNVIIFGVDTKNSIHSTNKTQNIYVMGKDFIQGISNTTIYAESIYKTNSHYPYIIMVIILIYLLMELKNYNLNHLLII